MAPITESMCCRLLYLLLGRLKHPALAHTTSPYPLRLGDGDGDRAASLSLRGSSYTRATRIWLVRMPSL